MKYKIIYTDGTYHIVEGISPYHVKNLLATNIVADVVIHDTKDDKDSNG